MAFHHVRRAPAHILAGVAVHGQPPATSDVAYPRAVDTSSTVARQETYKSSLWTQPRPTRSQRTARERPIGTYPVRCAGNTDAPKTASLPKPYAGL